MDQTLSKLVPVDLDNFESTYIDYIHKKKNSYTLDK